MLAEKLLATNKITSSNHIEALKRLNDAFIQLLDHGLDRDLQLLTEMRELRSDLNHGFQEMSDRLDKSVTQTAISFKAMDIRLESVDTRLESVEHEIKGLRSDMVQQTEILKMIAENTKPLKQ